VLEFFNLGSDLFSLSKSDGEETHLDEHITQKFGSLLSNRITSEEDIILLSPFFNFGLILIEGLKSININVGNSSSSSFFNVSGISENANLNKLINTLIPL